MKRLVKQHIEQRKRNCRNWQAYLNKAGLKVTQTDRGVELRAKQYSQLGLCPDTLMANINYKSSSEKLKSRISLGFEMTDIWRQLLTLRYTLSTVIYGKKLGVIVNGVRRRYGNKVADRYIDNVAFCELPGLTTKVVFSDVNHESRIYQLLLQNGIEVVDGDYVITSANHGFAFSPSTDFKLFEDFFAIVPEKAFVSVAIYKADGTPHDGMLFIEFSRAENGKPAAGARVVKDINCKTIYKERLKHYKSFRKTIYKNKQQLKALSRKLNNIKREYLAAI